MHKLRPLAIQQRIKLCRARRPKHTRPTGRHAVQRPRLTITRVKLFPHRKARPMPFRIARKHRRFMPAGGQPRRKHRHIPLGPLPIPGPKLHGGVQHSHATSLRPNLNPAAFQRPMRQSVASAPNPAPVRESPAPRQRAPLQPLQASTSPTRCLNAPARPPDTTPEPRFDQEFRDVFAPAQHPHSRHQPRPGPL